MTSRSVVIAEPVRTAIGAFGGTLKDVPAPDLGAVAIRAAVERAGLKPDEIETVGDGQCHSGRDEDESRPSGGGPGRPAGDGPGHDGEPGLRLGGAGDCVRGAGDPAWATPMPPSPAAWRAWIRRLISFSAVGGVIAWETGSFTTACFATGSTTLSPANTRAGIPRTWSRNIRSRAKPRTNGLCARSNALRARKAAGHFKSQIAAVQVPGKKGPTPFDQDEANRPDTTIEALARLKPAFRPDGAITAGNAPGLNDAAAAMVLADEAWAEKRGLKPAARLVAYGIAAVEPGMFGLGPVPAVKQALQRAGWEIDSIERAEINEAFAAIAIVVARELGLSDEIVNVDGGAVAHGHPIGATGAVLTTKLIHSMRRDGLKRGLVTLCIGGGQGIALAIETLH